MADKKIISSWFLLKIGLLEISRLNETKRPDVAILWKNSRVVLDGLKSHYFLEGEFSVYFFPTDKT